MQDGVGYGIAAGAERIWKSDDLIPKSLCRFFSFDFGPLRAETHAVVGSEFNKGHGDAAEIAERERVKNARMSQCGSVSPML